MKAAWRSLALPANYWLPATALLLFAWVAVATAWLADDSFFSLRQVFHVINGQGFTWNYGVRVQAFTHPAWVILLTMVTALTRELFFTTIVVSVALSLASIFLVMAYAAVLPRGRCGPYLLFALLLVLAFSKAFTDYMTSGLENPLSFFLIGFALWQIARLERGEGGTRTRSLVFVLLALAFLNRFDHALLLLPLAVYVLFAHVGRRQLRALIPGCALIVGWFAFSVFYFGAPFPNTYYAKLVAGYPAAEVHARGAAYFVVSLSKDPVTAVLLVLGAIAGMAARSWVNRSIVLGGLLYAAYVFNVGGDFMQGRFFAVLAYLAVFNLVAIDETVRVQRALKAAALLVALGAVAVGPKPFLSGSDERELVIVDGIADERGIWYEPYGLLSELRRWPTLPPLATGRAAEYGFACTGSHGFDRGELFLIDVCGLSDPLTARLPAVQTPGWRVGHRFRKVPTDYGDFMIGRAAGLQDRELQPLLDDLVLATSGPLFDLDRLAAIVRLNVTGEYSFDRQRYTDPAVIVPLASTVRRLDLAAVDRRTPADGTQWLWPLPDGVWNARPNVATMFDVGVDVLVQPARPARAISISLDGNDDYRVSINGGELEFLIPAAATSQRAGLFSHVIELPEQMRIAIVHVTPARGDGVYAIGHVELRND